MKIEKLEENITLSEGVTVTYSTETRTVQVKGEKGELSRLLYHPRVAITIANGMVTLVAEKATMREKKQLFTFKAHINNMIKGVTEGFTYKLKICSGHFPMSVAAKDGKFEVKNFIGEKVPRQLTIKPTVDVKVDGETITVTGTNKELVGQTAGDIEQLTRRPGFDTRIFQDGIFIIEKDGKSMIVE